MKQCGYALSHAAPEHKAASESLLEATKLKALDVDTVLGLTAEAVEVGTL